jgi:hypothetical protein
MNIVRRVVNKFNAIIYGPSVRDRIVVKVLDGSRRKNSETKRFKPNMRTYHSWSREKRFVRLKKLL